MFAWAFLAGVAAVADQPRTIRGSTARVTVRGCVAESMGRYMLNNPMVISPKPTPPPTVSADPSASKSADAHPYELIGGAVKPHVGQQVEVVGTVRSEAEIAAQAPDMAKPTAHPIAGRITVRSLRVLTPTCP